MDMQGNVIKTYDSCAQAGIVTNTDNSSITKCCKGKVKSAGGFTWKYNK